MTANGTKDAHVQVLTAEVRTLVVGSRQVTLSVYNQLDSVNWQDITPFGRVAPKGVSADVVHVVGAEKESGALVRSWLPATRTAINSQLQHLVRAFREADPETCATEKVMREILLDAERLDGDADRSEQWALAATARGDIPAAERYRRQAAWDHGKADEKVECAERMRGRASAWNEEANRLSEVFAADFDTLTKASAEWLELPLIVLAGLR